MFRVLGLLLILTNKIAQIERFFDLIEKYTNPPKLCKINPIKVGAKMKVYV